MNEELALDPGVASHVADLRLVLAKVGFYEGRFISRFPGHWSKMALEGIADQNVRQRVQALLERAREYAFLPSGRDYDSTMPWIHNALQQQHSNAPFEMVIAAAKQAGVVHIDDFDPPSLPGSRDARIIGTVENIMKVFRPLLALSGNLVLIDPYFKPWISNTKILFQRVLTESFSSRRCISFTAFVSHKEWLDDMRHADAFIVGALPKSLGGKQEFRIVVCDDTGTVSKLHARCLFSEKGGINLDKGLQSNSAKIVVSFMDKTLHEDLMQTFVERPLPFNVVREFKYQV